MVPHRSSPARTPTPGQCPSAPLGGLDRVDDVGRRSRRRPRRPRSAKVFVHDIRALLVGDTGHERLGGSGASSTCRGRRRRDLDRVDDLAAISSAPRRPRRRILVDDVRALLSAIFALRSETVPPPAGAHCVLARQVARGSLPGDASTRGTHRPPPHRARARRAGPCLHVRVTPWLRSPRPQPGPGPSPRRPPPRQSTPLRPPQPARPWWPWPSPTPRRPCRPSPGRPCPGSNPLPACGQQLRGCCRAAPRAPSPCPRRRWSAQPRPREPCSWDPS